MRVDFPAPDANPRGHHVAGEVRVGSGNHRKIVRDHREATQRLLICGLFAAGSGLRRFAGLRGRPPDLQQVVAGDAVSGGIQTRDFTGHIARVERPHPGNAVFCEGESELPAQRITDGRQQQQSRQHPQHNADVPPGTPPPASRLEKRRGGEGTGVGCRVSGVGVHGLRVRC